MKQTLYILYAALLLTACSKSSSSSPAYSFGVVMDSLGLQTGKQYAYKHYTANALYEQGYVTFNSDTSFTEIMNADTFHYF